MVFSCLKKGIIWRVGNGTQIRTWRDLWIPCGPSFKPTTLKRNCRLNRVSDFMDDNGIWNNRLLNEHFWPMDVLQIRKIRTSPRQQDDFLAWHPEKSGYFTVII